MKQLLGVMAFAIATFTPTQSHAYCIGADQTLPGSQADYYSVPKEFERAKFVVEAVVTKETWIDDDGKPKPLSPPYDSRENRPWGLAAPFMGAWYDVQVTMALKGTPPESLRLFSENSTGRFWLNTGEKYLLFVTEGTFDQPIDRALTLDTCGNSASDSPDLRRQLELLATSH